MSLSKRILAHLNTVQCATNRQLQDACEAHGGEVARDCARLIRLKTIQRVDGGKGRGTQAIYALAERDLRGDPAPGMSLRKMRDRYAIRHTIAKRKEIDARRVNRAACARCGVREDVHADLGCRAFAEAVAA